MCVIPLPGARWLAQCSLQVSCGLHLCNHIVSHLSVDMARELNCAQTSQCLLAWARHGLSCNTAARRKAHRLPQWLRCTCNRPASDVDPPACRSGT